MMFTRVFVVLAAVWCELCSVGAIELHSSPETFLPGITPNLTLSCTPGNTIGVITNIVVFQLSKGGLLLATGKADGVTLSKGQGESLRTSKYSGTNEIDLNNVGSAFMLFTIQFPEDEDEGDYICHMNYEDKGGFFQTTEVTLALKQNATEDVSLRKQLEQLKQLVDNTRTRVSVLETQAFTLATVNAHQSRAIADLASLSSSRIAFFATLGKQSTINTRDVVVFDHVTFNNGSAFNSTSGVFLAPRSGFYMLSLVCEVQTTIAVRMEMLLKVNDTTIMKLFITGQMPSKGGQQSGSLTYYLPSGSEVKVIVGNIQTEASAQVTLLSENLSYFSGYFLG